MIIDNGVCRNIGDIRENQAQGTSGSANRKSKTLNLNQTLHESVNRPGIFSLTGNQLKFTYLISF